MKQKIQYTRGSRRRMMGFPIHEMIIDEETVSTYDMRKFHQTFSRDLFPRIYHNHINHDPRKDNF